MPESTPGIGGRIRKMSYSRETGMKANGISARRKFVVAGCLFTVIIIASMLLLPACGVNLPVPPTSVQTSTHISSMTGDSATAGTTTAGSTIVDSATTISNPVITSTAGATVDTGTGPEFTIPFPSPGDTAASFLTFYNSFLYTATHFWVEVGSNNTVTIGFTDYGQLAIGNPQVLELPQPGTVIEQNYDFGFVEGGYMEWELIAPVSGTVLQTNEAVLADYSLVNQSPYGVGWLIVVQMSNPDDLNSLLTPAEYASECCPPCHCEN
jgi:glycine cleavage system H protein